MTASCREQENIAERFFRIVDLAVLQFGDTLVPQRLLLALSALQLSPVSFLAEFPAQAGGESVQRSIVFGCLLEQSLRGFVISQLRSLLRQVVPVELLHHKHI